MTDTDQKTYTENGRANSAGSSRATAAEEAAQLPEPRVARWMFHSFGLAPFIWLVVRLYFGFQWMKSGWGKLRSPAWMSTGSALKGFAAGAVKKSQGGEHPEVNYGWWVSLLHWIRDDASPWMAKLVAMGELVIGIAFILGLYTGIAALLGLILNTSYGLSGSAGVNPMFVLAEIGLVLSWRNAGYIGLDRFVLRKMGMPWAKGPRLALPATQALPPGAWVASGEN